MFVLPKKGAKNALLCHHSQEVSNESSLSFRSAAVFLRFGNRIILLQKKHSGKIWIKRHALPAARTGVVCLFLPAAS